MNFGSEELHLALKAASDADDLGAAAELLYEPVRRTARFLFAKRQEFFRMYTPEDQEDAIHDALLYMLEKLRVIADPPNEGVPNYSYYANFVFNGLCQRRRKLIRAANEASLDAPIAGAGDGDDKEQTILSLLPSKETLPEAAALARDTLEEALRAFFALPNEPDTLAAVGLIILNEALGQTSMSLKDYAEALNGRPVHAVLDRIEQVLAALGLDARALDPVRKRLGRGGEVLLFSGVTEGKLANRKNSITTKLRKAIRRKE